MERYSRFLRKNYKKIIVIWLAVAILLSPLAPMINQIVVYDVEVSLPNSEFQKTVDKLNAEFAHKNYTEPYLSTLTANNYYILIKSNNPYSEEVKNIDFYIREKFGNETHKYTFSYYKLIEILLVNLMSNYTDEIRLLYNNSFSIHQASIEIKNNLSLTLNQYHLLLNNTKLILSFLYGPPSVFLNYYMAIHVSDFYIRSEIAKKMTEQSLNLSGPVLNYFNSFYNLWLQEKPFWYIIGAQSIIDQIGPHYLQNYFSVQAEMIHLIFNYSNLTNWYLPDVASSIALDFIKAQLSNIHGIDQTYIAEFQKVATGIESIDNATFNIIYANIKKLINDNSDNILKSYIKDVINQQKYNESIAKDIVSTLITNLVINTTKDNPYFTINYQEFKIFVEKIIENDDLNETITEIIKENNFENMPINLNYNVKSSFIDEKDGIFMIIVYSNHTLSNNEIDHDLKIFDQIKNEINSKDIQLYITGISLLSYELKIGAENALFLVIPLGLLVVFLLTTFYFRSFIAGALVISLFAISIVIAFAIGYLILGFWLNRQISFISPSIVVVLTLGLSSDYSVYLLRRYKIERDEGKSKDEAIHAMTFWSSRGVLTSSLAVLFSYIILSMMNIPLFGDAAIANTIGVSSTMITSLLFFPSIIYALGDKALWPFRKNKNRKHRLNRIYEIDIKRKVEISLALTAITLISLLLVANINTVLDVPPLMPDSEVQKGSLLLYSTIGSYMSPIYIYIEGQGNVLIGDNINQTYLNYVQQVADAVSSNKDVKYVYTLDRPLGKKINIEEIYANDTTKSTYLPLIKRFVGSSNKSVLIEVIIDKQPFSLEAIDVLKDIRALIPRNNNFTLLIDGVTQLSYDSKVVTDSATPSIIVSLITVIAVILFLQL
ncbi:MAG TPA: MMPL family transporter, partial [Geobacterales bacterium]|nr:MMPL family transporter [Geobacterales bacterium]